MIVVADTSPLNYLVSINEVDVLPALFEEVILPSTVFRELQHARTPEKVRLWIAQAPSWLKVRSTSSSSHPALLQLHAGEKEAIQLALELGADLLLIDETDGRHAAEALHLRVRGTLGILERAAQAGLINFREAFAKLEQTRFRISPALREQFLRRNP